jgi:putative hemolysin
MRMPGAVPAVLIAALVVAWLTAASIAVRAASRIWLRHWMERRPAGFAVAERYIERPTRLVIAAAAGSALAIVLCGVVVTSRAPQDATHAILYLLVSALFLIVFGKLIPRAIARRWPSRLIPVLLPPLRLIEIALWPIVALSRSVERRSERARQTGLAHDAREGIEDLLREGEAEGVGARDEIAIITGVVRFGEKTLRDVMTPRSQVFALDESLEATELARRIAESAYSRVPITRNDSLDDVVGMVHAFDVLRADGERPAVRTVPSAPADTRCNDFLYRMLRMSAHLAVVRDGAGHTVGIVTLEDLLEELVGDIRDEHDEAGPAARTIAQS